MAHSGVRQSRMLANNHPSEMATSLPIDYYRLVYNYRKSISSCPAIFSANLEEATFVSFAERGTCPRA
jgi:hypothetical protein